MTTVQSDLFRPSVAHGALESIDVDAEHGEVFTRRWVVELILRLADYTPDRELAALRVVEPACGGGAFLRVIAEYVSESCRKHGRSLIDAIDAVRAFDLLPRNVQASRDAASDVLHGEGWPADEVATVVERWVTEDDFLLRDPDEASADFIVGNPPYVRLEDVPGRRMDAYRAVCRTMIGRADLYVGFYEVALRSLKPGGVLGFICADRWMRNQYGRVLRQVIADSYSVDVVISMHDVDAFHDQVAAYPAITILRNGEQGSAIVVDADRYFDKSAAVSLTSWLSSGADAIQAAGFHAAKLPHWFPGDDLWPTGSPARLTMIEHLNDQFPKLEDSELGVKIGIGVATGADSIFITTDKDLVESDRLLPMAMVRDTTSGELDWSGHFLVNPWNRTGGLVDLNDYPRLQAYFNKYAAILKSRHTAKKNKNGRWFHTIDKVNPELAAKPKLLFPDMKLVSHPVLDPGGLYPHHNLYYLTSDTWDLRVLGGLLLSKVAETFIEAYAVKMRGKTLRFQAQYLRRIRIPHQSMILEAERAALADAFDRRDSQAATEVALRIYGLDALPN